MVRAACSGRGTGVESNAAISVSICASPVAHILPVTNCTAMMRRRHVHRNFIGADGEGGDIADRHEYLLLRVGHEVLETGTPLTPADTLPFLASLPPFHEYVSFFFDYDVTMICRDLPEERVRRLLNRDGRTPAPDSPRAGLPALPVDVGDYQIDYLPHKEFRVRHRPRIGSRPEGWVVINDVGSFFQCSFVTALRRWGIGDEGTLAAIEKGKGARASFGEMTQETREYNALEIELLEDLMTQFRQVCVDIGYVPRLWQGPGNLAKTMLAKHDVPRTKELPVIPDGVWQMAQAAYYGGRFERTAVGPIKGPVDQWDINAAYPYACTLLPCLVHAKWSSRHQPRGRNYVAQGWFSHPAGFMLNHFPIRRKDGSVHYPRYGKGWYWSVEIQAAVRAGATFTPVKCWEWEVTCDCKPFDWLIDVYLRRLELGKTGKGMVLKLGTNSIYGVQAQSIGAAPFANPIYAGLITAITRATLIDTYSLAPDACFMLATDGLFMGTDLSLTPSTSLGGWDLITHSDGMFIIQPGLYFAGEAKPKTRGVPMGKVFERRTDFELAWANSWWAKGERLKPGTTVHTRPQVPSVDVHLRNFIGLRLAYARGKPETAGMWVDAPKNVSFDWAPKRRPMAMTHDHWGARVFPHDGAPGLATVPYSRNIGGNLTRDLDRLLYDDGPEWADDLRGLD